MRILHPVRPPRDVPALPLVQKWMSENGYNQSSFAAEIGVTAGSVNRWCNGVSRPDEDQKVAIEDKTGVPRDAWLMPDELAKRYRFRPVAA